MKKTKDQMWSETIMRMMTPQQVDDTWPMSDKAAKWCQVRGPLWARDKFDAIVWCTRPKEHKGPHVDHIPNGFRDNNSVIWKKGNRKGAK